EHVFLDSSTPSIVSNQVVSTGGTKTYMVRTELPKIIPPTYKGTTIRYFYYVRSTLAGRWLVLENGQYRRESMKNPIQLVGVHGRSKQFVMVLIVLPNALSHAYFDYVFPCLNISLNSYYFIKFY
ncbi:immunoglobulin, partial [Thalictrum thalictroides]